VTGESRLRSLPFQGGRQFLLDHPAAPGDEPLLREVHQLVPGALLQGQVGVPGALRAPVRGPPLFPPVLVDRAGRDFLRQALDALPAGPFRTDAWPLLTQGRRTY